MLNSVVSLFYYARVLRAMYLGPTEGERVEVRPLYGVTIATLVVPTIVFGLYWMPVFRVVSDMSLTP